MTAGYDQDDLAQEWCQWRSLVGRCTVDETKYECGSRSDLGLKLSGNDNRLKIRRMSRNNDHVEGQKGLFLTQND